MASPLIDLKDLGLTLSLVDNEFHLTVSPENNAIYSPCFSRVGGRTDPSHPTQWIFRQQSSAVDLLRNLFAQAGLPPEALSLIKSDDSVPPLLWQNEEKTITVSDYSDKAWAVYLDRETGKHHSEWLRAVGGKYNGRLKDPHLRGMRSPGWIFAKSQRKASEAISQLTGGQVGAKTPEWESYPASQPIGAPHIGAVSLPVGESKSVLLSLDEILNRLLVPLSAAEVEEVKLSDPRGFIRLGYSGPKTLIDKRVEEYLAKYPPDTYSTALELDLTVGSNRVIILSRRGDAA